MRLIPEVTRVSGLVLGLIHGLQSSSRAGLRASTLSKQLLFALQNLILRLVIHVLLAARELLSLVAQSIELVKLV